MIDVSNHAIQVVGWDDNYPKSNFTHTPEKDGAWKSTEKRSEGIMLDNFRIKMLTVDA